MTEPIVTVNLDNNCFELKIESPIEGQKISSYENIAINEFLDKLGFPDGIEYSNNFMEKLHAWSVDGRVRPDRLTSDLSHLLNNDKSSMAMKGPSLLSKDDLGSYGLLHMHVEYHQDLLYHLNGIFKRKKFKEKFLAFTQLDDRENIQKMSIFQDAYKEAEKIIKDKKYNTGHWLIMKKYKNKYYLLDLTEHNTDAYILNAINNKYIREYPELFN